MGQYKSSSICTKDGIVEVGKRYQYKEGEPSCLADIEIMEINLTGGFIMLKFKVLRTWNDMLEVGEICEAGFKDGESGYFNGMWRLFDAGTYQF